MKNKRLYILTVGYIAIFAAIFEWQYTISAQSVVMFISIAGFLAALLTNFVFNLLQRDKEKDHAEDN